MEKRGISIRQDRHLQESQRPQVLRTPQVVVQQTPESSSKPIESDNKVVIIQNFYQEAPSPCYQEPPQEIAYYPVAPPILPRGLCPPPFAPPFAFYPHPCALNQPRPFCFR
jgi:hypothetical protein